MNYRNLNYKNLFGAFRVRQPLPLSSFGLGLYARENGWTSQTNNGGFEHRGFFRARGLRWEGFIREAPGRLEFFVKDPPITFIRNSRWGACFHSHPNGWYFVTFVPGETPPDADSGIVAITRVLAETFRPGGR
jgi:hypothetical protein